MKRVTLFTALLLASSLSVTTGVIGSEKRDRAKTYTMKKITGGVLLSGVMISKNSKILLKGLSENRKRSESCVAAAGQYYPSRHNKFGTNGSFMTKIHLKPRYTNKDLEPLCPSDPIVKKGTPYYFLALTGDGWYQMLYKGKVLNCLKTSKFPIFKQPKIEEWFKVACVKKSKKIWIKLDGSLLEKKDVCKLVAVAPDYIVSSKSPKIKGGCKL